MKWGEQPAVDLDEKSRSTFSDRVDENDDYSDEFQRKYSSSEERYALFKVDILVLLLLTLGLGVFQFDRMNLASALNGGFALDVHVVQSEINTGNELMFLGIFLLEIPANIILMKLGPRIWLSFQVFLFGFVAIMQIFLKNRLGFYASRFMLGIAESGYIPGGCYIISKWYKRSENASRTSIYFFGMFGGYALSPIICSAILLLGSRHGLTAWKWIFLIEGLATIGVGILMLLFLPGTPNQPYPLMGKRLSVFSDKDIYIINRRLRNESEDDYNPVQWYHVKKTLLAWKRYPHLFATAIVFATWSPLTTYTPTNIYVAGFTRIQANALTTIGGLLAVLVVFLFGLLSDKTNLRGISVLLAILIYGVVLIVFHEVLPKVKGDKWKVFGLWTLVNAFAVGYHPIQNIWMQLNCKTPQERSLSIAIWVMFAMIGLMSGSQLFRADDAPIYSRATTAMICMVFGGLFISIVQYSIYYVSNRRIADRVDGETEEGYYVL